MNRLIKKLIKKSEGKIVGVTRRTSDGPLSTTWEIEGVSLPHQTVSQIQGCIGYHHQIYFSDSPDRDRLVEVRTVYRHVKITLFGRVIDEQIEEETQPEYGTH